MQKGENFNHPLKGATIRVAPIKSAEAIEKIEKLLADHPRNLALFTLGVNTNLQPGELLNIRVGEVKNLAPMDTFEVKETRKGRVRSIELNHACIASIRNLILSQKERQGNDPEPDDPLFKVRRGRLSVSYLSKLVKKWCVEIDLKGNYGGYSLRKTYAYHQLFRFGRSMEELMLQLNQRKKRQMIEYLCLGEEEAKRLEQEIGSKDSGFPRGELKKREKDLESTASDFFESEEIYRILFKNAYDGIALLDTDFRVVELNEAIERIYGRTREKTLGKNLFDLGIIPPEQKKTTFESMKYSLTDQIPPDIREIEVIRMDGIRISVEVSTKILTKKGKPIGFLNINRDITDRKRMEQALKSSEEKARGLLDATSDAVMLVDPEGRILDLNRAYSRTLGRAINELVGLNLWALIPSDFSDYKDHVNRVFRTGQTTRFEKEYRGEWKDNVVYPVLDSKKNVSSVAIFSQDITKRKKAEDVLLQHRDHLEELVKVRTLSLEQTNTALKVLLKRREEDKTELEDKMVLNIKELVIPYLEDLKSSGLKDNQKVLADVIEYNLNDIIAPFVKTLSSQYHNLTATEIRIANLIKQGRSSKEIANQFNTSLRTIDTHRYRIRKKLGISQKKTNLATYLLSIN